MFSNGGSVRTVHVDADACPVRDEVLRTALKRNVAVTMVSNGGIRPFDHPLVTMVYVDQGADAADRWIAERAKPGDVVVTADTVLAARCIDAGALVLKPNGESLTAANIGTVLAMRDLAADLRAADPFRTAGAGRPFTRQDRSRFVTALERALQASGGHR